jgi:ribulose-phosphate 3-epimerase
MITISASVLSADFTRLGEQIKTAEESGVDHFHFDIMDGVFVPNISMGPFVLETVRKLTALPFDAHLMIESPDRYIDAFTRAGANQIAVHIENNPNILRTIQYIRSIGVIPTIVVNPATPASSIEAILPFVDNVLVMTVNPGFSGQVFIPEMVQKIKTIHKMINDQHLNVKIQVDGGITGDNINSVVKAGTQLIIAATSIFRYPKGIAEGIRVLRTAAEL